MKAARQILAGTVQPAIAAGRNARLCPDSLLEAAS